VCAMVRTLDLLAVGSLFVASVIVGLVVLLVFLSVLSVTALMAPPMAGVGVASARPLRFGLEHGKAPPGC